MPDDVATLSPKPSGASEQGLDHFVTEDGVTFAGRHLLLDLWGCTGLDDEALIERALRKATEVSGATLLHIHLHPFKDPKYPNMPAGVSGVAVLAESHISIHTWPEAKKGNHVGYVALDLFMCGNAKPHEAIPGLKDAFNATLAILDYRRRGMV